MNFVFELAAPDALTTHAGACRDDAVWNVTQKTFEHTGRITSLYHELLDNSMEYVSVVVTASCMRHKILHSLRRVANVQATVNIAFCCMNNHRVDDALGGWTFLREELVLQTRNVTFAPPPPLKCPVSVVSR